MGGNIQASIVIILSLCAYMVDDRSDVGMQCTKRKSEANTNTERMPYEGTDQRTEKRKEKQRLVSHRSGVASSVWQPLDKDGMKQNIDGWTKKHEFEKPTRCSL